ncbi:MAG: sugar-transfer associated ATP-grasp domain-containing protein [Wenzhouxiangella sp.]|jgi:hypothetical protein|nr:sugar-transfer associated ATP-grasp domain-containing protein [Wenzhouxiangella sp.]
MLVADGPTRIQRAILKEYLTTGNTFARLFDLAVALVFWPWRSTLSAWRLTRSVGRQITDVRSLSVQFFQQVGLAWFHGMSPTMYYQMGIARSQSRHRPTSWVQDGHAGLLSRVFRADKTLIEVNDKAMFARMMLDAKIPHPETVVLAHRVDHAGAEIFEMLAKHRELFLKRVIGHGGRGSRVLVKQARDLWTVHEQIPSPDNSKAVLDETQLIEQLRTSARAGCWLIQPKLVNHPLLVELFGPGLVSVRVVSARSTERFVILGVLISFPAPHQLVSQRGLKVGIDRISGTMGRVFSYSADQREFSRNPYTNKRVEGVQLPFWAEMVDLVERAHANLPTYPFLGWDVAICPEGPTVLEANGNFGVAGLQRPWGRPLIDDDFVAVFNDWKQHHGSVDA